MSENRDPHNNFEDPSMSHSSITATAIDPAELIPSTPHFPDSKSTLKLLRKFKWGLFCFVLLGGLGILAGNVYDEISRPNDSHCYEKIVGEQEVDLKKLKLNAEHLRQEIAQYSSPLLLNQLKSDVQILKEEIMKIAGNNKPVLCEVEDLDQKIQYFIGGSNAIDNKITKALETYDADKLALYDYAAEYAGGEVISTPDTVPWPSSQIGMFFGFFRLTFSSSPEEIIKPNITPGNCFKFYGQKGKIILKLGKKITVGSVSMEHTTWVEDFRDAPKEFKVFGLKDAEGTKKQQLGSFVFNAKREKSLQNFPVRAALFAENTYEYILLEILSNHGNPDFTSIYRFRVHSK